MQFIAAMKKLKEDKITSIDLFTNQILSIFFAQSLNSALEERNLAQINAITFPEVDKYTQLKDLAL